MDLVEVGMLWKPQGFYEAPSGKASFGRQRPWLLCFLGRLTLSGILLNFVS